MLPVCTQVWGSLLKNGELLRSHPDWKVTMFSSHQWLKAPPLGMGLSPSMLHYGWFALNTFSHSCCECISATALSCLANNAFLPSSHHCRLSPSFCPRLWCWGLSHRGEGDDIIIQISFGIGRSMVFCFVTHGPVVGLYESPFTRVGGGLWWGLMH